MLFLFLLLVKSMVESRMSLGIQVWDEKVNDIFEVEILDFLLLQKENNFLGRVPHVLKAKFLIQFQ